MNNEQQPVTSGAPPESNPADLPPALPVAPTLQPTPPAMQASMSSTNPVVQPAQPTPMTPPSMGTPKSSNKMLIIAAVVVVAVLLLLGGTAAAYKFWYQNPEKVLGDSLVHLLTEKGPVTTDGTLNVLTDTVNVAVAMKGGGGPSAYTTDATVELNIKKGELKGQKLTLKGSGIYKQDGTFYIKANDVNELVGDFADAYTDYTANEYEELGYRLTKGEQDRLRGQIVDSLAPFVTKVDGQWIRISADDLNQQEDGVGDQYECYVKAFQGIGDKTKLNEISDIYKTHRFVTVNKELGAQDGSLGYEIEIDNTKAKEFGKQVRDTTIGKSIQACNDMADDTNADSAVDTAEDAKVNKLQVWVSRWSHKLTHIVYDAEATSESLENARVELDIKLGYGKKVDIPDPKDAKSLQEVIDSFESVDSSSAISGAI
ncbi:MAG: hypothetical protein WBP12_02440 [Candidatus Saccharimonas sp.]